MNKFLVKMAYKDEGYSVWRHESDPIPLYNSEEAAYQQACYLFCKEIDFSNLDAIVSINIKNLILNKEYKKAILEINFSNTIKFNIIETAPAKANIPTLPGTNQLSFNFPASTTGATCRKCNMHNNYASPDGQDGLHTCYACKP